MCQRCYIPTGGLADVARPSLRATKGTILAVGVLASALLLGTSAALPLSKGIDAPALPGRTVETFTGLAQDAGRAGFATFLFLESVEEWVALVLDSGSLGGIDRVAVDYASTSRTLTLEAEDTEAANTATVLVSGTFIDTFVGGSEEGLSIEVSDGVQYLGLSAPSEAAGLRGYFFIFTHFSIQSLTIAPAILPPVVGLEGVTATGWAFIGGAAMVVLVAAVFALRRRP